MKILITSRNFEKSRGRFRKQVTFNVVESERRLADHFVNNKVSDSVSVIK